MPEFGPVACRLASGLILSIDEPFEMVEQTPTGPRSYTAHRRLEQTYETRGNASAWHPPRLGDKPPPLLEYGFALTPGIPRDFWDAWLKQHHDADYIKNGFVFAHVKPESTKAESREKEKVVTGFEPIDK